MTISTVWLTIISQCNNNCEFCYYKKRGGIMTLDTIRNFIHLFNKIKPKKIILIGGEPTLHPNFEEIVNMLYNGGFNVFVVTNGLGFSRKSLCKTILPKLKGITISIEGPKDLHNIIVDNQQAYNFIRKAIKNVFNYNIKILSTNTAISKSNFSSLSKLIDELYNLGIKRFGYNIVTNFRKNNITFSPDEFTKKFNPLLRRLIKKYSGATFSVVTPVPSCLVPNDLKKHYNFNCHIFSGSGLVIDSNNNILPCTHWVDFPIAKINSNISYNNFEKMWSELNSVRAKISHRPIKECTLCSRINFCFGGCPIFWRVYNPEKQLNTINLTTKP
ncbi:MAG: hypothetical protein COT14_03780 [Candidatus Diapherotrites archaeon CG08_land_8_20_14_0_20_30_16]|nr:MAG: hypothetical protein COT14_03780 [Candidatus Diapherotrites archaeon CG08_land_8_20_14_0_20_30_16]